MRCRSQNRLDSSWCGGAPTFELKYYDSFPVYTVGIIITQSTKILSHYNTVGQPTESFIHFGRGYLTAHGVEGHLFLGLSITMLSPSMQSTFLLFSRQMLFLITMLLSNPRKVLSISDEATLFTYITTFLFQQLFSEET